MSTVEDCPVCKGQSGGIGADGVEDDCHECSRRDALRYRYLRATTTAIRNPETGEKEECTPDLLDAAIDAAITRSQP